MSEVTKRNCAAAFYNGHFFCIHTMSGYRSMGRDPQGKEHFLSQEATDVSLGDAVTDALAHSRFLTLEQAAGFFDYELGKRQHAEWVESLMKRFAYKSRRALFKDMQHCSVESKGGHLLIVPMRHEKLESWGREKHDSIENVSVPSVSPPEGIGKALRLAFSRCV
jgi:CDI immunity protein